VYIFKKIYPLSIISNVVVVPLSAGGLFAGFWILLLDGLKWFLPSAIVAGGQILIECYLKFLIFMVRFFAHHMSCSFWVGSFDWKFSTGYYLTLLSAIHWKKLLVARIFTIGGCLLMAGVWLKERQESPAPSLSWLDTGRNLSCVFQLSPDKTILINPGALEPSDSTERILLPYLSEKRVSSLSFVLLNRLDPKTASGLITLLNEIPVSRVLVCVPDLERKNMWQTWLNENIKLKKPIYFLHAGEKTNWEGWTIEALPTTKAMGTQTPVLLSYSETKILLGDKWSRTTQRYLLTKKNLKATIMQARFSKKDYWEEEFLNRYQPNQLIEIGHGSQNKPTAPPWTQIACAVPQKAGYLNLPFPKEVNRQKSSSKSPRMRPPGHASGLSSQPLR
jgi:beta-lactamase superfamily II metal-dependent hydrolase